MQQILRRYIVGPSVRTCQGYPNLQPPHQKGKGNALVYGVCIMKKMCVSLPPTHLTKIYSLLQHYLHVLTL